MAIYGMEKNKKRAVGMYRPPNTHDQMASGIARLETDGSEAQGPLDQIQMMKKTNRMRRPSAEGINKPYGL